ncbi:SIR2 family protein [Methanocalculus sp.]|uniref:SIR2 family NAD-dependent protein deacylase n=1 Tax=Methanocalculus sp. TaxID=2004547 RepID=UPI00262AA6C4|nr:SIR2 family protein [Methanocalculus sp.]MDG6249831.1 SIR2 family protein [Methanocalculus sp.]
MSEITPANSSLSGFANKELDQLCELIRQEKVIFWVGSGFSHYAGYPTGSELSDLLGAALGEKACSLPLQEAADRYVEAKGRESLIDLLKECYGKEPERIETHKSLAHINRIKYIITTNYDPLFEHAYDDNIVSIAHDDELPGITDYPDRTILLKIHGDLSDPESIVITSEDYRKFDRDSIVWSKIKSLLAEYSVVFIGYSVADSNVREMLKDIYGRLESRKHPYFFIDKNVDEEKREGLNEYNLQFIEMDAATAIEYITNTVIQNAFVDGMKKPSLLVKSEGIFDQQGVEIVYTSKGKKVTHVSVSSKDPGVPFGFTLAYKLKKEDGTKSQEMIDLLTGISCDPVTIKATDLHLKLCNGTDNGILLTDPSALKSGNLVIEPHPNTECRVDLQSTQRQLRLSHLKAKVYGSQQSMKLEIDDPDFILIIRMSGVKREAKINFKAKNILSDVNRAREIYGLIDAWAQGESIELISASFQGPFVLKSSIIPEPSAETRLINDLYRMYNDLGDLQSRFHVKFQIPEEITVDEQEKILWLSSFVNGRPEKLIDVTITVANSESVREALSKEDVETLKLSRELWCDFELFDKILRVPFEVEGFDMRPINKEEIQAAIERDDQDLVIKWKSDTGNLYIKFNPLQVINADVVGSQKEIAAGDEN